MDILGVLDIANAGEEFGGPVLRGAPVGELANVFRQREGFQDDGAEFGCVAWA